MSPAPDDPPRRDGLLTVREAADRLGVHPQTLGRWIRRGDLPGYMVGSRLRVQTADVERYVDANRRRATERRDTPPIPGRTWAGSRDRLYAALLAGDAAAAERVLDELLDAGARAMPLHLRLLTPVLRRIGTAWAHGEVSIAHEHRATAIAERLALQVSRTLPAPANPPRGTAVTATLPGERHGVGLLVVADAMRAAGYAVHHLGVEVPPSVLSRFADEVRADVVALSTHGDVDADVARDLRLITDHRRVIIGGPGVEARAELPAGVEIVRSPETLRQQLAGRTSA